jgi:hypothetical protein
MSASRSAREWLAKADHAQTQPEEQDLLERAGVEAFVEIAEALTDISNALRSGVTTFDGGQA